MGRSLGVNFSHDLSDGPTMGYDVTRFYWVRFISRHGVEGPFSTPGAEATTIKNVSKIIEEINDKLSRTHLAQDLVTELDDIGTDIFEINEDIIQVGEDLVQEAIDRGTAIVNEADIRQAADTAEAGARITVGNRVTGMTWVQEDLAAAVLSQTQIDALYDPVSGNLHGVAATHSLGLVAKAGDLATGAASSAVSNFKSTTYATDQLAQAGHNLASASKIEAQDYAQTAINSFVTNTYTDHVSSTAETISTLSSKTEAEGYANTAVSTFQQGTYTDFTSAQATINEAVLASYGTTTAQYQGEILAKVDGTGGLVQKTENLQLAVDGDGTPANPGAIANISTVTELTNNHTDSINSIYGRYTVKVDTGTGFVAGFGLASTGNTDMGSTSSEFIVNVNSFAVSHSAAGTSNQKYPFSVIDGETVISTALIADGTITNAHVVSLDAQRITVTDRIDSRHGDFGTIKAGLIEDEAGIMSIDLNAGAIKIKDNNGVQRVRLGRLNSYTGEGNNYGFTFSPGSWTITVSKASNSYSFGTGDIQIIHGTGLTYTGEGSVPSGCTFTHSLHYGMLTFSGTIPSYAAVGTRYQFKRRFNATNGHGFADKAMFYVDVIVVT